MTARTLFEKIWQAHEVVPETAETPAVLYVDLHLVHEVTTPQAFAELDARGISVRRPGRTLGTLDHSTPTEVAQASGRIPIRDASAAAQVAALERNARAHGIELLGLGDARRGIVHVIGLRRQPYEHPRSLRHARLRHRHDGGGARARDAVPAAAPAPQPRGHG
jgi:3-isopropylmalate/(R)-2-methylmalate dehydratase large subunit